MTWTGEVTTVWPIDDLDPEEAVFLRLLAGQDAFMCVENLALGSATGGVRLGSRVTPVEVAPAGSRYDVEERGSRLIVRWR